MNREQYKRGGRKRKQGEEEEPEPAFNLADFKQVEKYYRDEQGTGITKDPENPVGYDQFNTYVSAMKQMHEREVAMEKNTCTWEQINFDIKAMKELAKKRKPRITKGEAR
jgi:hypothetical protein